jgi:hypothetical protein
VARRRSGFFERPRVLEPIADLYDQARLAPVRILPGSNAFIVVKSGPRIELNPRFEDFRL